MQSRFAQFRKMVHDSSLDPAADETIISRELKAAVIAMECGNYRLLESVR
jgi:hypothetical protein